MNKYIEQLPEETKEQLKEKKRPQWQEPMLATLVHEAFSDEDWIYERKLDGERCLAIRYGDRVRLMSRNEEEINVSYPELVEAMESTGWTHYMVDGEIVTFEDGISSFEQLQERMHVTSEQEARQSEIKVYYYLFDILWFEGYDVTDVPLRDRKALLKNIFDFDDPIRFLPHRNEEGEKYYQEACERQWEGIIAKDANSPYVHTRSKKWQKFKCVNQQEFVIGGFTQPHGERIGFGALLIGYYENDDLIYAGKVGTGFDHETLRRLHDRMENLERKTTPFKKDEELPIGDEEVNWITPKLVAEIGFTEWTGDGKLRHPRYMGLRRDKEPEEVHRETPQ